MILSTQTLPDGYFQSGEIDLKKNKRLAILLNIAALFITILIFYLLSNLAAVLRTGLMDLAGSITLGTMIILIGLVAVVLIIHELIHGFFFWIFTHSKPVFALHLLYAYAGAPTWYIPSRVYGFVALGPLVIIGAVGLLLILLAPLSWVLMIVFLVAMNTGGAIGSLYVFTKLLKLAPSSFANDTGDGVTFFVRP